MLLPESEQGRFFDSVQGRIDGVLQPENGQVLGEECETYTDGSAVQVKFKSIAHAPCPAAQLEKDISFRELKMQAPPDWPKTVVASELSAVTIVAKRVSNRQIKNATIVTVCQDVR